MLDMPDALASRKHRIVRSVPGAAESSVSLCAGWLSVGTLDDGRIGPEVAQRKKASEKPVESARATLAMIRRDRASDGHAAHEPAVQLCAVSKDLF
jgi:hypothetical protein